MCCAARSSSPRRVTPAWPGISEAIYRNVNAALSGRVGARAALQAADRDIDRALAAVDSRG
jgi:multiple sugar transport system substrate-binding protein